MSEERDLHPSEGGETARNARGGGYEVGYKKPPVATRFAKGRSGNPRGRPRKPKTPPIRFSDIASDGFLHEEAYRPVRLRENGRTIELPAVQAAMRAAFMKAIQGSRLAQKFVWRLVADKEEEYLRLQLERYARLEALKRKGEETLAEHRRKGLPDPELLPHPDDIVLDPKSGEAYVNGPLTPDEKPFYEHMISLRGHFLLRAARARRTGERFTAQHEGKSICGYLLYAQLLDLLLPRRYRWKDGEATPLMLDYLSLPRRELERRIAVGTIRLKETAPRRSRLPREVERRLHETLRRRRKRGGNPLEAA